MPPARPQATSSPARGRPVGSPAEQWNAAIAKGGFTAAQLKANDKDADTHSCPATFKIRFQGGRLAIFVNDELGWNGTYKIKDYDTFVAGDGCDTAWSMTSPERRHSLD